jgi:Zn finger protein HypA/HybF involved in hydrogenase expression
MRKCTDCGNDYPDMLDEKGNARSEWDFMNACDSCQDIRQHEGRCWACGDRLAQERKDGGYFFCPECERKCDALPGVEIPCPVCGTSIEQDPENLYEMWCPKCLENRGEFVQIQKGASG